MIQKNDHKILGCLLFSGSAKSIAARDKWMGWTTNQRLRNLVWVVNNSRFLIFPWVDVDIRNLASHALEKISRRIKNDWQKKWNFQQKIYMKPLVKYFRKVLCFEDLTGRGAI